MSMNPLSVWRVRLRDGHIEEVKCSRRTPSTFVISKYMGDRKREERVHKVSTYDYYFDTRPEAYAWAIKRFEGEVAKFEALADEARKLVQSLKTDSQNGEDTKVPAQEQTESA